MTPREIATTVERIVAGVANDYGLKEEVSVRSELQGDLGMDDVDIIEVMTRAEERFEVDLPDSIGPASTVRDIVDVIAARLREKEALLAPTG